MPQRQSAQSPRNAKSGAEAPSATDLIDEVDRARPNDDVNSYELELATIRACRALVGETVDPIVQALDVLLASGQLDERRAFISFMAAATLLRRRMDHEAALLFANTWQAEFARFPAYWHLRAMAYLGGDLLSLQTGLRDARRALAQLPEHAGVLHSVADFNIEIAAFAPDRLSQNSLTDAVSLVERAIALYPNRARFYYTRGRARRLLRDFAVALDDLGRAIQLERGFDSQLRIAVYHAERTLVQSDRTFAEFLARSQQAQSELEAKYDATLDARMSDLRSEMTVKMTETVAFVTGFVSLVLTTSNLAAGRPLADAAGLMGVQALILFSLAFVGAWLLRRGLRRPN